MNKRIVERSEGKRQDTVSSAAGYFQGKLDIVIKASIYSVVFGPQGQVQCVHLRTDDQSLDKGPTNAQTTRRGNCQVAGK